LKTRKLKQKQTPVPSSGQLHAGSRSVAAVLFCNRLTEHGRSAIQYNSL